MNGHGKVHSTLTLTYTAGARLRRPIPIPITLTLTLTYTAGARLRRPPLLAAPCHSGEATFRGRTGREAPHHVDTKAGTASQRGPRPTLGPP